MITKQEALAYHADGRRGKIEVRATKPCMNQKDLSLAYTPGVAEPCREIARQADTVYEYTARGNLVAVITDGTAVLGLGDIGPLAAKPVMEGKGVLFKRFADIDVFDLELQTKDPDEFIKAVSLLEPTFGGINLEDIKAPQCFYIEEQLKKIMKIPVFHDDQHGTAIISAAALINAALLQDKRLSDLKIVFSGAGAAAISCARHYVLCGARPENITLVDSEGVVYAGRIKGMNPQKNEFAQKTARRTLSEAFEGADAFIGLSIAGIVTSAMVQSMAPRPIVFAMANPDPEIGYHEVKAVRPECVVATGRSDFPNQVNNVLGFPFIFRGALDTRASCINQEMKLAATNCLATIARKGTIPASVLKAYDLQSLKFGPDYIIPKPLDPTVLVEVSIAVAQAAMASKVARRNIEDMTEYRRNLAAIAQRLATE
ncbi:MAG: malate dehydrogenase [Chitinivibrionales bacterium]|nr:malate dehydrogenase [Chitinivibrionales bacterium]